MLSVATPYDLIMKELSNSLAILGMIERRINIRGHNTVDNGYKAAGSYRLVDATDLTYTSF